MYAVVLPLSCLAQEGRFGAAVEWLSLSDVVRQLQGTSRTPASQ